MANDLKLMFHDSTSASRTFTGADTTGTAGPVVDLGSNSVNRTLLLERRISGAVTGTLDIRIQVGTTSTSLADLPGTTTASLLGFAKATTNSYGSTDAVAPSGPNAIQRLVLRTDKQFVRLMFTTSTSTASVAGVTVVAKVMSGAFSGAAGPIDL